MNAKKNICFLIFILGFIFNSFAIEQKPILYLDFENNSFLSLNKNSTYASKNPGLNLISKFISKDLRPEIVKGGGVGGGDCIDLSNAKALPYYIDNTMIKEFDQIRSFTITGWFKSKIDFTDLSHQFILNIHERVNLFYQGLYKGLLELELISGSEQNNKYLVSSWYTPYLADERWVFFAITYDCSKQSETASFYVATEDSEVELDRKAEFHSDKKNWDFDSFTFDDSDIYGAKKNLSEKNKNILVIGGLTPDGKNKFKGALDQIRIYVSNKDNSACLTRTDIENIRLSDVGKQNIEKTILKSAQTEHKKLQQKWQNEEKYWSEVLNLHQVDSLEPIFSDEPPSIYALEIPSAPRGSAVPLKFCIRSSELARCKIKVTEIIKSDGTLLAGNVNIYDLQHVPVESNRNGGVRTSLVSTPPALWRNNYIRKAPFYTAEILKPTNSILLKKKQYYGVLVDVQMEKITAHGIYEAKLLVEGKDKTVSCSFKFKIYKTVINDKFTLDSTHWFWPEPEYLTNEQPPEWWSKEHWKLLENSGKALRYFGQTAIFTPLVNYQNPLIPSVKKVDGSYDFDFTKFDKWVEMFLAQGFKYIEGMHTGHVFGGVYVTNEETGEKQLIWNNRGDKGKWLIYLRSFYKSLYAHLEEKGWTDKYLQHQLDESHDPDYYKQLAELAKQEMPKVRTIDAMNNSPQIYYPLCDIPVPGLAVVVTGGNFVQQHKAKDKNIWLYHCCSPYPPFPNRHLDEPLACSRLYPWLCYLYDVDGYLWWAANIYRGANPYKTSLGPIPGGSQNPGHGPGGNWMFYPTKNGLIGSMRMIAFREGAIDFALLKMLKQKDPEKANQIMNNIAETAVKYSRQPSEYHKARAAILENLDK